jgi:hypothetical protein
VRKQIKHDADPLLNRDVPALFQKLIVDFPLSPYIDFATGRENQEPNSTQSANTLNLFSAYFDPFLSSGEALYFGGTKKTSRTKTRVPNGYGHAY